MKKLVTILLFSLISFLGFGQQVTAPDSKSFTQSTNGQDASGFTLSGFASTDIILASISLINPPTGTTFYLNTTNGLTAASGFTLVGNKTRLVFTGTIDNINTALLSLKINTGSIKGNVQLSVAATINQVGYYYNGVNGHFYKPISQGAYYPQAKINSHATTFKGQEGYLVTITSANEEAFIAANVPQSNIWFAATDKVTDGKWVIDDGPELGTVMKTTNAASGNIVGVYNNWCGGEPNGANHSEDYPVAKWNGAACWNDLNPNYFNPYVIEYGTWSDPDNATFTEFYTNSVSHTNGEVLTAKFNVNFGGNIDETKFSAKAYTYTNNVWGITNNSTKSLSGLGKVDLTSDLDTVKVINGGYKVSSSAGQVEWCVIYEYESQNGRYRIGIDSREVTGIITDPSTITNLQLFDLYNGPVTFGSYDPNGWTEVYVYTTTPFNFGTSTYVSNIRNGGSYHALTAEFTFSPIQSYKPHGIELIANSQTELNTLYNNIVTVSDVYLAFKELSNGGLFGNESGNEFTSGIQYMNADVDGNGTFNEADTYKLLQHLTGIQSLSQYTALTYLMKLYNKADYDAITKSNWSTQFNYTRNLYPFTLDGINNTYNLNVTWKGDVNLSHSAQQSVSNVSSNSIRTMSLMSKTITNEVNAIIIGENVGNNVIITISIDPLQQELVGTQFQLNYDNSVLKFEKIEFKTKGTPMNYGTDKGTYVNIGSLITDGSTILDNTTEYKITFLSSMILSDMLGLVTLTNTDAVNKAGIQLKVKVN